MHDPEPREDHQPAEQGGERRSAGEQETDAEDEERDPGELTPQDGVPREPRGNQRGDEREKLEVLHAAEDLEAAETVPRRSDERVDGIRESPPPSRRGCREGWKRGGDRE